VLGENGIERFDPESRSFTAVDSTFSRAGHYATLAADGNIWVAGGCNDCPIEIVDPRDGSVVAFDPDFEVSQATGTQLFDGRLLLATSADLNPTGLHVIDVHARTRTPLRGIASPIASAGVYEATLLPTGRILFAGPEGFYVVDVATESISEATGIPIAPRAAATLLPDGGVLLIERNPEGPMGEQLGVIWYESEAPDPSWRPTLDPTGERPRPGDTISLTGAGLLGVAEPTDLPGSAKSNHPVAIFMPLGGGAPTVGGFHDWTDTTTSWTVPALRQAGPGILFAGVAGQLGGTWVSPQPAETGEPCVSSSACASGVCLDGVCCEAQCGPCEACSAELSVDGVDGECHPALAGTDEHDDCAEDDVLTCGQTGLCDGSGECALYPDGTQCDEGLICLEQACVAKCFSNLHCPDGMQCNADGACEEPLSDGEPLGCTPCAATPRRTDHASWWWLAAIALWPLRRRR
jgi:hypothetical protein